MIDAFIKIFKPYTPNTISEKLYKLLMLGERDNLNEAIDDDCNNPSRGYGESKDKSIKVIRVGAYKKS